LPPLLIFFTSRALARYFPGRHLRLPADGLTAIFLSFGRLPATARCFFPVAKPFNFPLKFKGKIL